MQCVYVCYCLTRTVWACPSRTGLASLTWICAQWKEPNTPTTSSRPSSSLQGETGNDTNTHCWLPWCKDEFLHLTYFKTLTVMSPESACLTVWGGRAHPPYPPTVYSLLPSSQCYKLWYPPDWAAPPSLHPAPTVVGHTQTHIYFLHSPTGLTGVQLSHIFWVVTCLEIIAWQMVIFKANTDIGILRARDRIQFV